MSNSMNAVAPHYMTFSIIILQSCHGASFITKIGRQQQKYEIK